LAGGEWFQERRRHVMYFDEAAQGLQVGAPVVFLGVKVGTVKRVQLALDEPKDRFMVSVTIEIAPHALRTTTGDQIDLQDRITIRELVDRGLRARLQVQSLLTGMRYVDLGFHPDKKARFISDDPGISEIPTIPTTVAELSSMLEGFQVDEFLDDLAEISGSLRTILATEAWRSIPERLDGALASLQSLTARLDAASAPMLAMAEADLDELGKAIDDVRAAMGRIGLAADRIGNLTDEDSPVVDNLSRAGTELADAARALRQFADDEAPTVQHLNQALGEISGAARALRRLAESLEQEPEALFRGKRRGEE
ncbi:MAG: MlaD family protein, partial [Desulfobulbaceae bacterium]|nr:MlaD family protein [Desulfobulbaceae bacterium]